MTWLTMVLVGCGSYAFRVVPLLALSNRTLPPAVHRAIRQAGTAALMGLTVSSLSHTAAHGNPVPNVTAGAFGLVLAWRGASMLRVVIVGATSYTVAVLAVGTLA